MSPINHNQMLRNRCLMFSPVGSLIPPTPIIVDDLAGGSPIAVDDEDIPDSSKQGSDDEPDWVPVDAAAPCSSAVW